MITLITLIAAGMFGLAVFKSYKVKKNWGKAVEDTVKKVKKSITSVDPIGKLEGQIKSYKIKTAELEVNTQSLLRVKAEQERQMELAKNVANSARVDGNKEDARLSYELFKAAEENVTSIQADIDVNNELYNSMVQKLRGREIMLVKFESKKKRNEARTSANTIRRDIAKDELLEEGLFSTEFTEDSCEEEVEAIAIEKLNKDLKGEDVLGKYDVAVDNGFEDFFNDKEQD